jgi:VIT1/CCC1 family predicted Fe2+/Mn2+ transporter
MNRRAHTTGIVLIVGAAVEMLLFVYGALRRSYLALALPVAAAMMALTALTFWVGWTMLTMEEEEDEETVQPIQQT